MREIGCHKTIVHKTLAQPSIEEEVVNAVMAIDTRDDWRTPILEVLQSKEDGKEVFSAAKRREAHHYAIIGGVLCKQGYTSALLRCVSLDESWRLMEEVHEGECSSHIGGRALAAKVLRAGFYWPTMKNDCMNYERKCDKCQKISNLSKASPAEITAIVSPWPFALWGVDLIGPFPPGKRELEWGIGAVDYFTKWIEAEAMTTITFERVKTFY